MLNNLLINSNCSGGFSKYGIAVALHTSFGQYYKFSQQCSCIAKVMTDFEKPPEQLQIPLIIRIAFIGAIDKRRSKYVFEANDSSQ